LKAYWSEMTAGGIAGLSHFRTTIFSAKRLKTGVTDIGLKSQKVDGLLTLGTGVTIARNQ